MTLDEIYALIDVSKNPFFRKADNEILEPLLTRFIEEEHKIDELAQKERKIDGLTSLRLFRFFTVIIDESLQLIFTLKKRYATFIHLHSHAITPRDREQLILNFSKKLGATDSDLKKDELAFSRWFGADAVMDRCNRRISHSERKLALCLKQLGSLAAKMLLNTNATSDVYELWEKLNLEASLNPLLAYDGDNRILISAFHCLSEALQSLPKELQESAVESNTLQYIYRAALDRNQSIWIQTEALRLLKSLSPGSAITVLQNRLSDPAEGDDLFLRSSAVSILTTIISDYPEVNELLAYVAEDKSPYVRQTFAKNLNKLPLQSLKKWLPVLALTDQCSEVRAATILTIPDLLNNAETITLVLEVVNTLLTTEQNEFVIRVAFKIAIDGYNNLLIFNRDSAEEWYSLFDRLINDKHINSPSLAIRRWAAQTSELLWCESLSEAKKLRETLQLVISNIRPGSRAKVPESVFRDYEEKFIGRVMAIIAQSSFSLEINSRHGLPYITLGNVFGFRFWRLLYELRHPSSDKRQAFKHTVGRIFKGRIRAPSGILSELAETKVPGEPLFIDSEAGYRPYLPLMDDIISSLSYPAKTISLFSSEGITTISAPQSILSIMKARWILNKQFASYAHLRNWQEDSQSEPEGYIQELKNLGFTFNFLPYENKTSDPSVTRFFNGIVIFPFTEQWEKFKDYFFSVYENSLPELLIFTVVCLIYFLIKHIRVNRKISKIRQSFPLVIGGWGTRGKSGTERIKAAMLNAMGYAFVCKTTGCEAMFLHADSFGKMHEMLLFRPFDKATIWEQADVMAYAEKLGAEIFLWECMALTPAYVSILQRHWCQDDISTITNTFPDHEDIQGPAGINIPEVMTNFIPEKGQLITTEEQMLPILREAALHLKTEVTDVGWLDTGLLTPDVLSRFPYDEHPSNIALVLKLGETLGISQDFAIKEMADRVKPDIGVLKSFPVSIVNSRHLSFINGMSANERFGCLANWKRLHFDQHSIYDEPGSWITTVVNNRADRVARSQVFASILVNDISADKHFLIGSNLSGLMGYIDQAWLNYVKTVTIWPKTHEAMHVEQVLIRFAKRSRITYLQEHVIAQLQAMLTGIGLTETLDEPLAHWESLNDIKTYLHSVNKQDYSSDILSYHEKNLQEFHEYQQMLTLAMSATIDQQSGIDIQFRTLLEAWFKKKIYIVEDYYASGDHVIDHIQRQTPPGYLNRIMGMQNIKGTGLDFVYRWQAWDTCYKACNKLLHHESSVIEQGMRELASFQEFGILCEYSVNETLSTVKNTSIAQQEWFQAEITQVISKLNYTISKIRESFTRDNSLGWRDRVVGAIESIVDMISSVKRRKKADQIYQDLIDERISGERAVIEMQKLNKQQKGGWLIESIRTRFSS